MAQRSSSTRKIRVNLHPIRDRIADTEQRIERSKKTATTEQRAKLAKLSAALRSARRTLASQCCDNQWFCEFDV